MDNRRHPLYGADVGIDIHSRLAQRIREAVAASLLFPSHGGPRGRATVTSS